MEEEEGTIDDKPILTTLVAAAAVTEGDADQEMPGSSGSNNPTPTPTTATVDHEWCEGFSARVSISRKRKSTQRLEDVGLDDGTQVFEPSEERRVKLSDKGKEVVRLYPKVFSDDKILKVILQCLSDNELRRIAGVSTKWRNLAYLELRNRSGNRPFILFWKLEPTPSLTYEQFYTRVGLHYNTIWLRGKGMAGPLNTIISFTTRFLSLMQKDFEIISAIAGQHLTFLCVASNQISVTLPTGNPRPRTSFQVTDSSQFALQTLCIPYHPNFSCVSATLPIYRPEFHDITFTLQRNQYFFKRNELVNVGKPVKWVLILQCLCEDRLTLEFANSYVEGGGSGWSEVGGIMATVDRVVSNTQEPTRHSLSAILNIHGREALVTATYAFCFNYRNMFALQSLAKDFFGNAVNSFVILVYGPLVTKKTLDMLKEALGNLKLIGIQADHSITFRGFFLDEWNLISERYLHDSAELGVDVALGFIKY